MSIFPQLFTHIYYLGTPLASALVRVWAARKPAAYHTDLVLFENPVGDGTMSIIKYTYGSASGRPWGIMLPYPASLCICAKSTNRVTWKQQGKVVQAKDFDEHFARFRSSCGHVFLKIAACLAGVHVTHAAGVQILKQPFDRKKEAFPLDSRDWFHIHVNKVMSFPR